MRKVKAIIWAFVLLTIVAGGILGVETVERIPHLENQLDPAWQTDEVTIRVDLAFVGYDQAQIDRTLLDKSLLSSNYFEWAYREWNATSRQYENRIDLRLNLDWNIHFASGEYAHALDDFIEANSWSAVTSALDTAALNQQEETGERMSIFLPQHGTAINGTAVEAYLATHPAFEADYPGYTIYLLNFSRFDSVDHEQEHWFEIDEVDPDSNRIQTQWRLEWDNDLNRNVEFPYPAWGFRNRLYFIDPYCHQWYTQWTEIWWNPDELEGSIDYRTVDLDTYLTGLTSGSPEYQQALADYLSDWLNDIVWDTAGRVDGAWKNQRSISAQILMLNDPETHGYTQSDLDWILHEEILADAFEYLIPPEIATIEIKTTWANLTDLLDLETIVTDNTLSATELDHYPWFRPNWTYLDGFAIFDDFLQYRETYFNLTAADAGFSAWILLMQNISMVAPAYGEWREFTGLGGSGNVVCFKDLNRYFASDGATPLSGLTTLLAHEIGHVFGLGHAELWSDAAQGAGGFMRDTMSYYAEGTPHFSIFTRDAFYRMASIIARQSTDRLITQSGGSLERNNTTYSAIYASMDAGKAAFKTMDYLEAFLHYRQLYMLVDYLIEKEPSKSSSSLPPSSDKSSAYPGALFILILGTLAICVRKPSKSRSS